MKGILCSYSAIRGSYGLTIKQCPICRRPESGPYAKKIKGREYLYFAHSYKNQEKGRHYAKWCYIGPATAIEVTGGVAAYLEIIRSPSITEKVVLARPCWRGDKYRPVPEVTSLMREVPSPFRILDSVPEHYKEDELKIRNFSLIRLVAFDTGSVADVELDPRKICEYMVHNGLALANSDPEHGIHGYRHHLASKLNLIDDEISRLSKSFADEDHDRLDKRIDKELEEKLKDLDETTKKSLTEEFADLVSLLVGYTAWDGRQNPEYAERRRFSRAILYPILVKFGPVGGFRPVRVVISIHKSGVGILSFWLCPADRELSVKEILSMTGLPGQVEVEFALPTNVGRLIENAKKYLVTKIVRRNNLDEEAKSTNIAREFGIEYACYSSSFLDLAHIYFFSVLAACLDYVGKEINLGNLKMLSKVQPIGFDLLHLHQFPSRVEDPPKEIVGIYPRQILGLGGFGNYENATSSYVRNGLMDFSATVQGSWFVSPTTSLQVSSSESWEEVRKKSEGKQLFVPDLEQIGCSAWFETLNCLKQLLKCYDSHLTDLLEKRGASIDEVKEVERKIANGLEEMYSVRHTIFASVRDWWPLAERRLGIEELNRAVESKLSVVRRIINIHYQTRLNQLIVIMTATFGSLEAGQLAVAVGVSAWASLLLSFDIFALVLIVAHFFGTINLFRIFKRSPAS
jgi:hypothetical protein